MKYDVQFDQVKQFNLHKSRSFRQTTYLDNESENNHTLFKKLRKLHLHSIWIWTQNHVNELLQPYVHFYSTFYYVHVYGTYLLIHRSIREQIWIEVILWGGDGHYKVEHTKFGCTQFLAHPAQMGAMSLWHDEASAFRRASVRPSSILISKCFFTIFYPILIPFASYDSAH